MTAHSYLSGVKRILRFEDIEIINEKLKAKVNLPPMYPQVSDRIPTIEEFQRMLNVANLCGKTMLTMLASSGMRIGEALSLKVGSIFFERPTRIVLKPSETKTWRGRGVMAHF
jgi:integrase